MNFRRIGELIHDMHSQTLWNDRVTFGTNSGGAWFEFHRKDQAAPRIRGVVGWDKLAHDEGDPIKDAIVRAFDRAGVGNHERMSFMQGVPA